MPRNNSGNWSVNEQITAVRIQDINEDLDDIYANGDDRGRIVLASSGEALKIDIAPFTYKVGSSVGISTGLTNYAVTDDATNYVEVNSTGIVSSNTTAFSDDKAPVGIVIAASGVISSIELYRIDISGGSSFVGGDGIDISGDTVSVDTADTTTFVKTSSGASDKDKVPVLNATGKLDNDFVKSPRIYSSQFSLSSTNTSKSVNVGFRPRLIVIEYMTSNQSTSYNEIFRGSGTCLCNSSGISNQKGLSFISRTNGNTYMRASTTEACPDTSNTTYDNSCWNGYFTSINDTGFTIRLVKGSSADTLYVNYIVYE